MRQYFQNLFDLMSKEENWHESIKIMAFYSISFMMLGFGIAWVVDKLRNRRRVKLPVSIEDLSDTYYHHGSFKRMKKVR